jgi:hypothetical protein
LTIADAIANYQTQADMANYYNTGTTGIDGLSVINPSTVLDLTIGNTSSILDLKGINVLLNSVCALNGHTLLSGTTNLVLPLSEHYILTTAVVGTVNLPVITSAMYGTEVTFTKINATNSYTINAYSGNTFRLLGSSSSATQTSIVMSSNFTVLKIVATQSTVWNVLISNNYEKINSSIITANTSLTFPFSENYQIATPTTTAITITIPTASVSLLGVKLLFRRVNNTMAQINCSGSINDLSNTATTVLLSTSQYTCEIECLANSTTPTYGWYMLKQNGPVVTPTFISISSDVDWNTSPPANGLPHFISFCQSGSGNYTLTLPLISSPSVYEGMVFEFRRTDYGGLTSSTTQLFAACSGTDTVFGRSTNSQISTTAVLLSGTYAARIVCFNKTTTPYNWAFMP